MNKKFIISAVVMGIASLMAGFIVHGTILHASYQKLAHLYRPESDAQGYLPFMMLAHALIGIGLTWIYRRGHEAGKPFLAQGLRFGAAIAVVSTIPVFFIYYAVMPLPSDLVAMQIALDTIAMLVLGVLVAWVNRNG